jgi:hypothetical protein
VLLFRRVPEDDAQERGWSQEGVQGSDRDSRSHANARAKSKVKNAPPLSRIVWIRQSGGTCIICLDTDPPPIQSRCACRGEVGLAHVACPMGTGCCSLNNMCETVTHRKGGMSVRRVTCQDFSAAHKNWGWQRRGGRLCSRCPRKVYGPESLRMDHGRTKKSRVDAKYRQV